MSKGSKEMMRKCLKKTNNSWLNSGNRGFSLIVVLVIAIFGLTMAGFLFQLSANAAGAGRSASAKELKYNILQDGIEIGKAELRKLVENAPEIPKYTDKFGGVEPDEILNVDTLLIEDGEVVRETWDKRRLGRLGIAGDRALFKVRIYDMQYKAELVPGLASGRIKKSDIELLPPSLIVSAGGGSSNSGAPLEMDEAVLPSETGGSATNAGAYMIRASLELGGRESMLDTAVIQANNK
jgi:hypothetical protein